MLRITAFALLGAICTAAIAQDLISAEDFGDAWPFIFKEGYVACHSGKTLTVMDAESGRMYPLNGTAKGKASSLGLEPLESVWLDNPDIPGTKVSIGPVIEQGLQLCQ